MKTIKVTDEVYERLMEMAENVSSQDNRGTAEPYFFQIREDKKVWDSGTNRAHLTYVDFNCDAFQFECTQEGVKLICDAYGIDTPDNLDDMSKDDIHEYVMNHELFDIKECSYDIVNEYKNAFFTEAACKEHIERNGYHYRNPVDYLQYAFRNPEMELMFELFKQLNDQEGIVREFMKDFDK